MKRRLWTTIRSPQRLLLWPALTETRRFLLLAILIGIFAGLLAVCFHVAIEFVRWSTLERGVGGGWLWTLLSPAVGGLLAVVAVIKLFPEARGSGVNDTKAALYIYDGHVPFSTVTGKFLACSVSIGAGNSLGPEDPALQMGAGIASLLGRIFKLSRSNMRLIAPVGAAAGIGAAFNTPITAVLFVIEEIVAGWSAGVLGSIVLAAVSAVVVERWFLGNEPLFLVPEFQLTHFSELAVYAAIGVAGGFLSVVFVKMIAFLRPRLARIRGPWGYSKPVVAGLLVGFAGLWLPEITGAGYGAVDSALHDRFSWQRLILLGIVKMFATLVCFSAGTPGGMFAPTLFTGAMIGGGLGGLAQMYWPSPTSAVSAYVLVGMGTFFAGVFRTPMTSIFMIFEVSASYVIILPVMIANTIAYLISRSLQRDPFFRVIAVQEGLDLPSLEEQRESRSLRVEDAMPGVSTVVLTRDVPVSSARAEAERAGVPYCFISDGPERASLVRAVALKTAELAGKGKEPVHSAVSVEELPVLHPDQPLDSALRAFGSHPVLPVASRARPHNIVGALTLQDVHRAYGIHLEESPADQPRD